jgi:peptidylprolyl isomerase
MSNSGVKHGNAPKKEFVVEACGELCTLDKSHIVPMPWKLFNNVSYGFDEDKFGAKLDPAMLKELDLMSQGEELRSSSSAVVTNGKPWSRFW